MFSVGATSGPRAGVLAIAAGAARPVTSETVSASSSRRFGTWEFSSQHVVEGRPARQSTVAVLTQRTRTANGVPAAAVARRGDILSPAGVSWRHIAACPFAAALQLTKSWDERR